MKVNFVDLSRQYKTIAPEISDVLSVVLERCDFVLGRDVKQFEEQARRCPDIAKARPMLGWEPIVSLEEGLRLTVDYFRVAA
jgi:nucleoside-diphosphate-sugar epimerase